MRLQLDSMPDSRSDSVSWRCKGTDWVLAPIRLRSTTFIYAALYMTAMLGPNGENILKLRQLMRALGSYRLPFVVAADWNMEPHQLANTGLLQEIGADIVTPAGVSATCYTGRMLDYLIVSRYFAPAV